MRPLIMKVRRAALPLGIIVGVFSLWGTAEWWTANDLARAKARAKAAGMAVSARDMREKPLDPDANAAESYRFAGRMFSVLPDEIQRGVSGFIPYSKESMVRTFGSEKGPTRDLLFDMKTELKPLLREVDRAASMSALNWDRKWEPAHSVLLPEYATFKRIARVLLFDAEMALEEEDAVRALRRFVQIRKLVHHAYREPIFIGLSVGMSLRKMMYAYAVHLSRRGNQRFNAGIAKFLTESDSADPRNAIKGEAFRWADLVPYYAMKARSPGPRSLEGSWQHKVMRSAFVQRGMQVRIFDHFRDTLEAFPSDPDEVLSVNEAFAGLDLAFGKDESIVGRVTSAFMPSAAEVGQLIVDTEAFRRMARIQVELNRRFARNWPAKLPQDLVQIADPWSKKQFVYRRETEEFLLYSVGANRTDDGGHTGGLDVVSRL